MSLSMIITSKRRNLGLLFWLASTSRRIGISAFSTVGMTTNVISNDQGKAAVSDLTSKEFLLQNPSGAYTTARTCAGGQRIFEWETHVQRTADSLKAMTDGSSSKREFSDPSLLRGRLDAAVQSAIELYRQQTDKSQPDQELKITALVGKDDFAVQCHVTQLPPIPSPPVKVEVRGCPRQNAAAKDSSWVLERKPLEELMQQADVGGPINELLLTNSEHQILEGSQTNFYAIINGELHTAQDGILAGTVRGLVLDVCQREGIPVVLEPPSLKHQYERSNNKLHDYCESWEGALLSSTSRLALPIDELYIPRDGMASKASDLRMRFNNEEHSLARRIQTLVTLEVEARSSPIGVLEPVLA